MYKEIVICVAMKEEFDENNLGSFRVLYTGVGKVQAATTLCRDLCKFDKPLEIWNYGTAGGLSPFVKGLVEIGTFIQRDMNAEPIVPRGTIPFSDVSNIKTSAPHMQVRCGTGDSFVTQPDPWFVTEDIDCVDMEGWALAYVAKQYNIPFRSWKYITDMADEYALDDWTTNVAKGAKLFKEMIKNGI